MKTPEERAQQILAELAEPYRCGNRPIVEATRLVGRIAAAIQADRGEREKEHQEDREACLATAERLYRQLEAERDALIIRAGNLPFVFTPVPHNRHGCSSAYHSGFENGFRGWKAPNCYTREPQRSAWYAGHGAGVIEFECKRKGPEVQPAGEPK